MLIYEESHDCKKNRSQGAMQLSKFKVDESNAGCKLQIAAAIACLEIDSILMIINNA